MDPEKERDLWLRRLDATGRAQSRYLWITLLACLFFLTLRLSAPSTQSVSVPVLDLKLNASTVLASGGTVIGLLIVASLGAILAWSRALQEYGGESWRDYAERLDMHPNFLDLAIYTGPGKANLFGKIAYFVYPLYFTLALGESAWLQWWVLSNRLSAWWVFGITGILAWLGEQHLREFQDNEKTIPTILTTSQKLSTGVDARNIRNIVLMRPINTMLEFKQIIGRGTRLYDGKDYFTIYDFVKAHYHFSDPEWDGEPLEPAPKGPPRVTEPPIEPYAPEPGASPEPPRQRIKVKLADGKARTIQHMMCTTFWHPDGTPMSAQQFMEMLFGKLPEFFKDEAELRAIWSAPETRKKLLQGLAEKGFGTEQLAEMQKIIDAEKSDLFDVLAHVAYALTPVTREERAAGAKIIISRHFNSKQQDFLNFVLSHYVRVGVEELDQEKLRPLLRLKYHNSIADALVDLGRAEEIGHIFAGFQKYLYQERAAA